MKLEVVEEYLLSKGFKLEQKYRGNIYYCSIYELISIERIHVWYNNEYDVGSVYKEITDRSIKNINSLQRPYNIFEEIREFKINKIIKKEDTSL